MLVLNGGSILARRGRPRDAVTKLWDIYKLKAQKQQLDRKIAIIDFSWGYP